MPEYRVKYFAPIVNGFWDDDYYLHNDGKHSTLFKERAQTFEYEKAVWARRVWISTQPVDSLLRNNLRIVKVKKKAKPCVCCGKPFPEDVGCLGCGRED